MAYDEELADRIRETMLGEPGLGERKMFGGLAVMLNQAAASRAPFLRSVSTTHPPRSAP